MCRYNFKTMDNLYRTYERLLAATENKLNVGGEHSTT